MSTDNENTNFLWGHSSLQRNFRKNLTDTDFVNVGRKIKTVQVKECSLKEVIDGIVITTKAGRYFDEIKYTDDGNYYTLKANHSVVVEGHDMDYSNTFKLFFEDLFETYGVKTEAKISVNNVFMKIYKM
jgi:hypothetical protein